MSRDIWRSHHYAKDAAEASALAIKAGQRPVQRDNVSGAARIARARAGHGSGPESRPCIASIDCDFAWDSSIRLSGFPFTKIPFSELDSPEHEKLALEASRQSLVLLKNDGTLPWDPKTIKNLAILGPTGQEQDALVGNYAGTPARPVNLVDGLRKKLEPMGVKVTFEPTVPLVEGYNVAGDPIPAAAFFTDQAMSQPGLSGAVYADSDFKIPAWKLLSTDAQIKFSWNDAQPVTGIPTTKANIRWTGFLVPTASGDHVLSVSTNGAYVLKLDGRTLLENKKPRGQVTASKLMTLEAGHPYNLTLDYAQTGADGKITLGWVPPGSGRCARARAGSGEAGRSYCPDPWHYSQSGRRVKEG